jgi:ribonuclease T2
MRRKPAMVGGALALGLLVAVMSASARHRNRPSEAAPGEFDYYLLSLSWSPAFCLQSPGAAECNGPRHYGFIVHGLWPQNERGWPEYCGDSWVPETVAQNMSDIMPARALVYHEWKAHGTCSGLGPDEFFSLVRRAYASLSIPAQFSRSDAPVEQPPPAIAAAFLRSNPRLPPDGVVVTCSRQGAPRLREVHICFSRDLAPRACSPDAAREACRSPTVIVPPIR